MRFVATPLTTLALILSLAAPAAAVNTLQAFSSAALSQDPGFTGMWKYTIQVNWSFEERDLGHLDLFLAVESFDDTCHGGAVLFPTPAGTSTGENLFGFDCSVEYAGEFLCKTDPSLQVELGSATVKFEPTELGCYTGQAGQGTFYFYSSVPPGHATSHGEAIAVKHGQFVHYGDILGPLPIGPGDTPLGDPVVVNEFLVRPPVGQEEFLELKNNTPDPVDLDGWNLKISWRDPATGNIWISQRNYGPGDVLPAGGYFTETTDGELWDQYCGSCIGVTGGGVSTESAPGGVSRQSAGGAAHTLAPGDDFIFDRGGLIILYDDNDVVVDQVGYGNTGGAPISCPLLGGGTLPPGFAVKPLPRLETDVEDPPTYATTTNRTPDGTDTDNDASDFQIGAPTPDAPNVSATPDLGSTVRLNTVYVYPLNTDNDPINESVEFYNPLTQPVDIGTWYVSDGFLIRPIFPAGSQVLIDKSGKFTVFHGVNGTISFELEADDRIDLYDNRSTGLTRVDQLGWIRVPEFFPNSCFARTPDGAGPSSGYDWETSGGFVTLFYESECGIEAPSTSVEGAALVNALAAPYPNPSRGSTTFSFTIGAHAGGGAFGRVGIFDVAGREIGVAGNGYYPAGRYTVSWDGRTRDGGYAASGTYFARLILGGQPSGPQRTVVHLRD